MRGRLLVTGFGPFPGVTDNPSATLARSRGADFELLDVTFKAVEELFERIDPNEWDALVMIGVAVGRDCMCIETTARNAVGASKDASGVARRPGKIDPAAPDEFITDWRTRLAGVAGGDIGFSDDAGTYLCNFAYWNALRRTEWQERAMFLHIPTFDVVSLARQKVALREITDAIRITTPPRDAKPR